MAAGSRKAEETGSESADDSGDRMNRKFSCATCSQVFFGAWNYGRHLNTGHRFKCDKCNEYFPTAKSMKEHKSSNHVECSVTEVELDEKDPEVAGEPKIQCQICKQFFYGPKSIMSHTKVAHLKMCDICDKQCPTFEALCVHMKSHGPSPTELLPIAKLSDTEKLGKEDLTSCGDFKCEFCDQVFSLRATLWMHQTHVHNKDGGSKDFKCNIFRSLSQLRDHKLTIHSDQVGPATKRLKC